MNLADMTLVSTADHVVEAPDVFAEHLPADRRADGPQLRQGADGATTWVFQGVELGAPGGGARIVADDAGERGDAAGYGELPRSSYDSAARIRAMDRNGIWSSLSYPLFAGFAGDRLFTLPDLELSRLVVSAYNDWQLAWTGEQPGRLVPLGVLPVWDIDAAVAETHRLAGLGVTAVTFPESPYSLDLPSFSTDHWDPLLAAVCDGDLALCLQAASPTAGDPGAELNPFAGMGGLLAPQAAATVCTDLVVSGVFDRFPGLRVANAEGGIGWIPFLLDRIDFHLQNQVWTKLDVGEVDGTALFRKHYVASFTSDPSSLFLRERIGVESIAWSAGFPLPDSVWPSSPEALAAELAAAAVTDAEIDRITWQNAARFLRLELPTDLAGTTVGALRGRIDA